MESRLQRMLEAAASADRVAAPAFERRAGAARAAPEPTFVTAITVGKSGGWDPQEVWLTRVHRPRLKRQP